jgi:hypothetical protein
MSGTIKEKLKMRELKQMRIETNKQTNKRGRTYCEEEVELQ